MSEHLIAVKWNISPPPYAFLSFRNLKDEQAKVYYKELKPGTLVNWKISDSRICIGHAINRQEYYYCENPIDEKTNYIQCYSCMQKDFHRCFQLCDPSICPDNEEAYKYCESHQRSVYLALIADRIKVGVSFNPIKRWVEQGADCAVEVFRAKNGLEARKLEIELSKNLNITQSVRVSQKKLKLNDDSSSSLKKFREIKNAVFDYLAEHDYSSLNSELYNKEYKLAHFYGKIPQLKVKPIFNDVRKTQQVRGEIIGVKGKLLVTKLGETYYTTNLSAVLGHLIVMYSSPPLITGQRSLYDFLGSLNKTL
ncbi:MAG: DUF2797 domain-containing protein [Candidatus Heimdallarchaeaceae archaeon]